MKAVTHNQKAAIRVLIAGGNIAHLGDSIRVRDKKFNPVTKLTGKGFHQLRYSLEILRKTKKGLYVISPSRVKKLHGNSVVKKMYNEYLKTSHNGNN